MKLWIPVTCAALVLVPALAHAQHAGHGGHESAFGGGHDEPAPAPRPSRPPPPPEPRGPTQVYILVDEFGFSPKRIPLKVGEAAEIIVMRRTEKTCVTELVVPDLDVNLALPLDQPVKFALKPTKAGTLQFACRQGHVRGEIVVR